MNKHEQKKEHEYTINVIISGHDADDKSMQLIGFKTTMSPIELYKKLYNGEPIVSSRHVLAASATHIVAIRIFQHSQRRTLTANEQLQIF